MLPYHKPSLAKKDETHVTAMSFVFLPFSNCRKWEHEIDAVVNGSVRIFIK